MADAEETIDTHVEKVGILWAVPALMEGTCCETQKPCMFILCSTEGGSASFGERSLLGQAQVGGISCVAGVCIHCQQLYTNQRRALPIPGV